MSGFLFSLRTRSSASVTLTEKNVLDGEEKNTSALCLFGEVRCMLLRVEGEGEGGRGEES